MPIKAYAEDKCVNECREVTMHDILEKSKIVAVDAYESATYISANLFTNRDVPPMPTREVNCHLDAMGDILDYLMMINDTLRYIRDRL